MGAYASAEEEWAAFLLGTHPHFEHKSPLRLLPSSPRCKLCAAPFRAPGSLILGRGYKPWPKNPKICSRCFKGLKSVSRACPGPGEEGDVGGAEVELSMLFADVRGSSQIARRMPVMEFTQLMNRFYRVSSEVLVEFDAVIEKFVGDEVVGLFIPFMVGREHARRAADAATALLVATGHGSPDGPWVPIGVGVHTGTAFVGIVTTAKGVSDFTALGDPVNIAAHLASQARSGEVLVTAEAAEAAAMSDEGLERRHLELKGHPVDALVVPASRPSST
jgi:adenylate cyclase